MDKMVKYPLFNNFYKGRRVLITGHTGFKGSWLSILLNWLEAEVYGYALNPHTIPSLYEVAKIDKIVSSAIGDIRDFNFLLQFIKEVEPEIIIHMAAQSLVRESYKNPRETYEINVMGTVNLFEAARQVKSVKAILNVTTDKCYENREWCWGYRENDSMGGFDPYSNSKGCSELVTSSYRDSFFNSNVHGNIGVALASARAGNVIGGGDWANDRLIPDFIRAILKGDKLLIRNPYAIRPWQHVLEPLTGYLILCEKLCTYGRSYAQGWNFGPDDSEARNVEWITQKICELWGNANYEIDSKAHPHEALYLKLDCSKAKTLLEWNPKWTIVETLQKIVEWHKALLQNTDMRKYSEDQISDYFTSF